MKKQITVKDKFNISEKKNTSPVKGVVVLKKEDGTIIFKKNNLVVKEGRKIVADLFYNAINPTSTSQTTEKYSPSIVIGSGSDVAADNNTITSFENSITVELANLTYSDGSDSNDIFLKFSTSISGTGTSAINMQELGIKLSKKIGDNNTKEYLFSRITFDSLPLTSGNTYQLDYYLYF